MRTENRDVRERIEVGVLIPSSWLLLGLQVMPLVYIFTDIQIQVLCLYTIVPDDYFFLIHPYSLWILFVASFFKEIFSLNCYCIIGILFSCC